MNTIPLIGSFLCITQVSEITPGLEISAKEGSLSYSVEKAKIYDFSHLSPDDWKWLCGIYEGEGSICYDKKSKQLNCKIEMTDRDVVERVSQLWQRSLVQNKPRQEHYKIPYVTSIESESGLAVNRWLLEGKIG